MEGDAWYTRWTKYVLILILAAAVSAVAHEFGHFFAAKSLGYQPRVDFRQGRVVLHDDSGALTTIQDPVQTIIFSAGGPALTLVLAVVFTGLSILFKKSYLFFSLAVTNAVMRLNMIIDGFNSDEGNIARTLLSLKGPTAVFMVPLAEWTLCIILASLVMSSQSFFPKSTWLIPLFAVVTGAVALGTFALLGLVVE